MSKTKSKSILNNLHPLRIDHSVTTIWVHRIKLNGSTSDENINKVYTNIPISKRLCVECCQRRDSVSISERVSNVKRDLTWLLNLKIKKLGTWRHSFLWTIRRHRRKRGVFYFCIHRISSDVMYILTSLYRQIFKP